MSSILEAVSKGTDLKHFNERKERVPNNFDAKKADNDLRACPVCKVVWEEWFSIRPLIINIIIISLGMEKKKVLVPAVHKE